MATFVYLEKTDETVTSCREVGKPALYPLDQRREECHFRGWSMKRNRLMIVSPNFLIKL